MCPFFPERQADVRLAMKSLVLLAGRILLAVGVTSLILSWLVCQWFCFGLLADAARIQLYVHVDAGGWFFDLRRPEIVAPERGLRPYFQPMELVEELPDGSIDRQQRQPVVDQFDRTGRWWLTVPGLRLLWEDSSQLFRGGYRLGLAIRHWALLLLTAIVVAPVARRLRTAGAATAAAA